jgi:hypothetical protein
MEDDVFPSPAVAGLMKQHMVESRQHTDTKNTLTDAQFAANRDYQARIAGSKANPFFVVVDQKTGAKLGEFKLKGNFTEWQGLWQEFATEMVQKAGRKP